MRKRLKKVAIFTGNRAEFGLQLPILREIKKHKLLSYQLIVSGAHLDSNFGKTLKEIRKKGYKIDKKVKIKMDAKSLDSNVLAIGSGVISISRALKDLKPDIFIVYADRFEGLSAVIASTQMNIPTAHIEGGDITEGGALDDSVRHAMTKLSHLHFTTNYSATKAILSMGEERWRVHTVGFPAIDLIKDRNYAKFKEIEDRFKIKLSKPTIIFTQHSVTTEFNKSKLQIKKSISALIYFAKKGYNIIITFPNNDAGGADIVKEYEILSRRKIENIQIHKSIGQYFYHGILSLSKTNKYKVCCVGNSSSGIKETPAFGCPTVNIGSRQNGRIRGQNVIDTSYNKTEIINAINKCFSNKNFLNKCKFTDNPYFLGNAGKKIANIISKIEINDKLMQKKHIFKINEN